MKLNQKLFYQERMIHIIKHGSSAVECRTRNQESPGLNPPFAIVSKCWYFCSLHDAPVHSAVEMSTWL